MAVAAGAIGVVLLTSGDDSDESGTEASEVGTATTSPDRTDTTGLDDAQQPAGREPSPEGLVPFSDDEAGYRISIPENWGAAALHGDTAGAGAEAFPDDPTKAALFEQGLDLLPRAIIFVAMNPDEMTAETFASNINIVVQPAPPGLDTSGLPAAAEFGVEAVGGEVIGQEDATTAAGPAVRIDYDLPSVNASGMQWHLLLGDDLWVITCSSADMSRYEALFESVAESFQTT